MNKITLIKEYYKITGLVFVILSLILIHVFYQHITVNKQIMIKSYEEKFINQTHSMIDQLSSLFIEEILFKQYESVSDKVTRIADRSIQPTFKYTGVDIYTNKNDQPFRFNDIINNKIKLNHIPDTIISFLVYDEKDNLLLEHDDEKGHFNNYIMKYGAENILDEKPSYISSLPEKNRFVHSQDALRHGKIQIQNPRNIILFHIPPPASLLKQELRYPAMAVYRVAGYPDTVHLLFAHPVTMFSNLDIHFLNNDKFINLISEKDTISNLNTQTAPRNQMIFFNENGDEYFAFIATHPFLDGEIIFSGKSSIIFGENDFILTDNSLFYLIIISFLSTLSFIVINWIMKFKIYQSLLSISERNLIKSRKIMFPDYQQISQKLNEVIQIQKSLNSHLPENLPQNLNKSDDQYKLEINCGVLVISLSGLFQYTQNQNQQALKSTLNLFYNICLSAISKHMGSVDQLNENKVIATWQNMAPSSIAKRISKCSLEIYKQFYTNEALLRTNLQCHFGIDQGKNNTIGIFGDQSVRCSYTIIGPSIDIALKLKRLNKTYETKILISKNIASIIKSQTQDYVIRFVDHININNQSEDIYELIPCSESHAQITKNHEFINQFKDAHILYMQGDWPTALIKFKDIAQQFPEDNLIRAYISRLEGKSPPPNWQGYWDEPIR